jgi:hypothetical protein
MSVFNAFGACGDLFIASMMLLKIPPTAIVRDEGGKFFWRENETSPACPCAEANPAIESSSQLERPAMRPDDLKLAGRHPAPVDVKEQKALADIEQYGCHIIHVLEDEKGPPFSYSVGVQKSSGVPEVIVIGLKRPVAQFVINEYNRRIRAGERFEAGTRHEGFLEGFSVQFEIVAPEHFDYFGWDWWYYDGNCFDVLQIIYPTTIGIWPWDPTASESFRKRQPILADNLRVGDVS